MKLSKQSMRLFEWGIELPYSLSDKTATQRLCRVLLFLPCFFLGFFVIMVNCPVLIIASLIDYIKGDS